MIGKYAPDVALKNDLLRSLLTNHSDKSLKIFSNKRESYFEKSILDIKSKEKAIGKVILLRNITPFQERDVENTHFIATVSHALKAPVSAISKILNQFENENNGQLTIEQRSHINQINENIAQLNKITSELIGLTKKD